MSQNIKSVSEMQKLFGSEDYYLIYQLATEEAGVEHLLFRNLEYFTTKETAVEYNLYRLVYTGILSPQATLDDIYTVFNVCHPDDFKGHSLSVSDVVVLYRNKVCEAYFVDSIGFQPVPGFFPEEVVEDATEESVVEEITVLVVEPGKVPYFKTIPNTLEAKQKEVGGYIQAIYPFAERVAILSDEEEKFKNYPMNRLLRNDVWELFEVLVGTFLIVGLSSCGFASLSEEDRKTFFKRFQKPETFIKLYGKTHVIELDIEVSSDEEWGDDSDRGCGDCPDDECTGHCMSCYYRPV